MLQSTTLSENSIRVLIRGVCFELVEKAQVLKTELMNMRSSMSGVVEQHLSGMKSATGQISSLQSRLLVALEDSGLNTARAAVAESSLCEATKQIETLQQSFALVSGRKEFLENELKSVQADRESLKQIFDDAENQGKKNRSYMEDQNFAVLTLRTECAKLTENFQAEMNQVEEIHVGKMELTLAELKTATDSIAELHLQLLDNEVEKLRVVAVLEEKIADFSEKQGGIMEGFREDRVRIISGYEKQIEEIKMTHFALLQQQRYLK